MKKLVFLSIFLSTICLSNETKFHFRDCVKVTNGFYKNCKGRIENTAETDKYEVKGVCKGEDFGLNFSEQDLELTKGCLVEDW